MSDELYDVAVIGAGPAGSTVALTLASNDLRVVLVDRDKFPRPVPCAGWLSARAAEVLDELEIKTKPLLKHAFNDVTFYRADFSQSAKPAFEKSPGYLIDRAAFDHALVKRAVKAGVTLVEGEDVTGLSLMESSVNLALASGKSLTSKLLILASGRGSPLLDRIGVTGVMGEAPIWSVQVEAPLKGRVAPKAPRVTVVFGLDTKGSFGLIGLSPERMSVGVNWAGSHDGAAAALADLCRRACSHNVVPLDLSQQAVSATPIRSPTSAALDIESHVGKHTLVIGDAGGFVAAASNEGVFPAMWSARIAAEVAERALHSVHSQEELMTFDSAWRMKMADYLRSPHTDIQFLLPLIFTNQPMADRMGAAFFLGENI